MSSAPFATLDPARYPLPAEVLAEALSPALVVWEEHVRSNVSRVIEILGGDVDRWRPHVKTTKLPRVWRILFEAGVRRVKCATTRELDQLLATARSAGSARCDVLHAMVPVGPAVARIGELAASYPEYDVSVLVEDPRALDELPERVGVFVDLDLGMGRTGVPADDRRRIEDLVLASGHRLRGLHAYDGHRHGPLPERTAALERDYARLAELVDGLHGRSDALGRDVRIDEVCTAGTPALLPASRSTHLRELHGPRHTLSPGTVVLHDVRSEEDTPELGLTPAALVLTRVLSHPGPGRVTFDAGSKALGAEADGAACAILGHHAWTVQRPSEEHLPVAVVGPVPARGDAHLAIPRHVCTTVHQHDEAIWIDRAGRASTLRVSARGHELFAPLPTRFV